MNSRGHMAWRTAVTLAFLVLVPLAALLGNGALGKVRNVLWGEPPGTPRTSGMHSPFDSAPDFGRSTAPLNKSSAADPRPARDKSPPMGGSEGDWEDGRSPGSFAQPEVLDSQSVPDKSAPPRTSTSPQGTAAGVRLSFQETEGFQKTGGGPHGFAIPIETSGSQSSTLRQRLRALYKYGARRCTLELWGGDGELYRFQCELPLPGVAHLSQHFEAIDEDPDQAVGQVYDQVMEQFAAPRTDRPVTP